MTATYALCYGQEIDPFLKICNPIIFPLPWVLFSPCQSQVTPGAAADAVRGQGKIHVPYTGKSSGMYKPLKAESKTEYLLLHIILPGLLKNCQLLCIFKRHMTAEVTCHSWKAYGIPFILLWGMLCNAVIPTAKYHHGPHILIEHIMLLGCLQLQSHEKAEKQGEGRISICLYFLGHTYGGLAVFGMWTFSRRLLISHLLLC